MVLTLAFIVAEGYALWFKGDATIGLVPLALLVVWLFVVRLETSTKPCSQAWSSRCPWSP